MTYKSITDLAIENFVMICQKIGNSFIYSQTAGGNVSTKIDMQKMIIKATGFELKNIDENRGFVMINYHEINSLIEKISSKMASEISEDDFNNFIRKTVINIKDFQKNYRPSIEAGFHALMPYKYVIHTHSLFVNILCCSKEGEKILHDLFADALWLKYENPGKNLTLSIAKAIKSKKTPIIFLQNHGIIVGADDAIEVLKIHDEINKKIIEKLNLNPKYQKLNTQNTKILLAKNKYIFPDQVVYLSPDNLIKSTAYDEMNEVFNYLISQIYQLNFEPNFISSKNVEYIKNMESEKFRQSLKKS
jgi:rhamnose utilization protein RhaD (predicted bifunctional aldolase and dehydrogenase)